MRRLALFCGGFAAGIFLAQYLLPGGWAAVRWLGVPCIGLWGAASAGMLAETGDPLSGGRGAGAGVELAVCPAGQRTQEALADTQQALTMTLTEYPTETRFGAKVTVPGGGTAGETDLLRRSAPFAAFSRSVPYRRCVSAKRVPHPG